MPMTKDSINLMPADSRRQSVVPATLWTLAAAVFVLVWLILFGNAFRQRSALQKQLRSLEPQQQAFRERLSALQRTLGLSQSPGMSADKVALIRDLLSERVVWSEVFRQFSRIVPPGLWFDSLEGSSAGNGEITIRGSVMTYEALSRFMMAMEQSPYFLSPRLHFAQKSVAQGRDVVAFEIACGIRKGPGPAR